MPPDPEDDDEAGERKDGPDESPADVVDHEAAPAEEAGALSDPDEADRHEDEPDRPPASIHHRSSLADALPSLNGCGPGWLRETRPRAPAHLVKRSRLRSRDPRRRPGIVVAERPWPVLLLLLSLAVAACGGSASPSPTVTPAPATASPAPTPAPTEPPATPTSAPTSTAPATNPPAFESTLYPYALQLPPGVLTRQWKPATVPWDGQARIATESPSVDLTSTINGILLIFGLPWDADLGGFAQLVRDNSRFNGCSEVGEPRQVEVDGVAGVTQRQACALGTQALYLVLVRDGYGMGFRMRDFLDPEAAADELVTWLGDGLTWTLP